MISHTGAPAKGYRDESGNFIGYFAGIIVDQNEVPNPSIPDGAIECSDPPSGKAVWNTATEVWVWADEWRSKRREMYDAAGLTLARLSEAMAQVAIDDDSTELDAFKAERAVVRADPDFPSKPI